ncbi:MAG: cation:proton antiporter [Solidesulfovibrio sp. DCME]|uniref:cation:proton antiporter n=1 Tax=Solidesulfovibrio sp. DCME TaxID=3447380 RepID=UPI003D0F85D0
MHEHIPLALAAILALGAACQWVAWRVRLPAILFLLAAGFAVGPVAGWLRPDALLGDLLFPCISLAVAVILFEGSITLRFRDIAGLESVIRNLITLGVAATLGLTALATRYLLGFPWELACLFGAIMVVTGPTVIAPMLRTVRPSKNVGRVLLWEGILIDPIGATLAVLVYQFVLVEGLSGELAAGAAVFGRILAVGLVLGGLAGLAFGTVLRRYLLPRYLHNVVTLALVVAVFAASNALAPESGLLAVTVMGIWLANMDIVELEDILAFKESLSLLLLSTLFLLLAARVDLAAFKALGFGALGVFAAIQFLARPISAQLCALGSKLTAGERHLLAWVAPRGIVAAAISSLFAMRLQAAGYPEASLMVPLAFTVIVGTILLQSFTAAPLANWLGAREPAPTGFLVVGANPVALAIAAELQNQGLAVLVADEDRSDVREARMMGLPAYWGNPVSEHADRHLDLTGIGRLLALTPEPGGNALVAHYYRTEFPPEAIFCVRAERPESGSPAEKRRFKFAGRSLFAAAATFSALEARLARGGRVKTTALTEEFPYEAYQAQQREQDRLPLFAVSPDGRVLPFTDQPDFTPKPGWKIVAMTAGAEGSPAPAPEHGPGQ